MKKILGGIAGVLVALIVIVGVYKYILTSSEITVTVSGINKGDYVSLCPVNASDSECDQYTNIDDWWFLKKDSGKLQARFEKAILTQEPITVKVQGIRFTWFSWRKNIVKIVE